MWQGRSDGPNALRFHEVVKCIDLENEKLPQTNQLTFGLVGFACDEGIKRNKGRPGAVEGPTALRKSLAKLPYHSSNSIFYDFGDIICKDGNLEKSQEMLAQVVAILLKNKIKPIVIGGGHELAWGHYQGIELANPNLDCAIINIDAHYDLRAMVDGKGNSGTSFLQIAEQRKTKKLEFDYTCIGLQQQAASTALINQAKELNVNAVTAEEINLNGLENAIKAIDKAIKKHQSIYLTICMDVFAAAYAPGVSAPQALG